MGVPFSTHPINCTLSSNSKDGSRRNLDKQIQDLLQEGLDWDQISLPPQTKQQSDGHG